ncbi:type I-E CRISPR-associated protein Cas7/Cse4/CasC [Thioalkalivibrio thiocyanodenitrificans]|uniref:type I-E CRISPR-associated protein Cas7/Cse4/CasC n=1 Tax=Thioalkalivibrio thiocyanodenitrificans TaxID=243063 RepID=UPI0003754094|nr:type I-E CRISPR-associated protein Cas7/Cse4/CasC [Thioalkalivibrio thiocyanodenitrificans]
MFLQIHTLTSYPASLLNRDDAGLQKRIPFGNSMRLRVSSQCQKRHWRESLAAQLPEIQDGQRTRSFFTRTVLPKAVAGGVPEDLAKRLIEPLAAVVVKGGVKKGGDLNQPILFGLAEADYFVSLLKAVSQEPHIQEVASKEQSEKVDKELAKVAGEALVEAIGKDNLQALRKSALGTEGLTASLFGRMVTSDLLARVDAPVHVAHALTVHAANTEIDYFTVVDDLNRDDETGAAHANQSELGAGVFYGYVVVDIPLLMSNLTGCERKDWRDQDSSRAREILRALIAAILQKSPGAKLGSTAPYAHADFSLFETGAQQPRALSNAFIEALPFRGDLRREAIGRLGEYVAQLDGMYGSPSEGVRHMSTVFEGSAGLPDKQPVPQAVNATLDAIFGA